MSALDLLETDTNKTMNDCTSVAPNWLTAQPTNSSTTLPADCQYFTFIIYGLVAGTICILGLVGNLVSVCVFSKDSKTPVASFQLMALAVADNLFLALWFIHYSQSCS